MDRPGSARLGVDRQGKARLARRGLAWLGEARRGMARQGWRGEAWHGLARRGLARQGKAIAVISNKGGFGRLF